MRKPTPTRTLGPLHFEDLDPHRFEDLMRQLIYDFRLWRQLEGTGRTGADEGFDVRGFEATAEEGEASDDDEERDGESGDAPRSIEDRVWLIQCKRERAISPKKLNTYLEGISADKGGRTYGIIFAAACDFSKSTRDVFRTRTRAMGFAEAHLWGKGEIEDMLFQPKNDHLLFAYFGISLQVRRRSLRTDLRGRLAIKRKAQKCLETWGTEVLVRDASDERYPYLEEAEKNDRFERGRWYVYKADTCKHDGVHLEFRRHLAFLDDDGFAWDYAEEMNDAIPHNNPWKTDEEERKSEAQQIARQEAFPIWERLPDKNRAWLDKFLIIPYENILAIDEEGDEIFRKPHIYTIPFSRADGPFRKHIRVKLKTIGQWDSRRGHADEGKRVNVFSRARKSG
jgi:hypothetical protein